MNVNMFTVGVYVHVLEVEGSCILWHICVFFCAYRGCQGRSDCPSLGERRDLIACDRPSLGVMLRSSASICVLSLSPNERTCLLSRHGLPLTLIQPDVARKVRLS